MASLVFHPFEDLFFPMEPLAGFHPFAQPPTCRPSACGASKSFGRSRLRGPATERRAIPGFGSTQVRERESESTIEIVLPGVARQDVRLDVEENVLALSLASGHFRRRFTLGREIDRDNIQASLFQGILRVTLPHRAPAQVRRVPVLGEGEVPAVAGAVQAEQPGEAAETPVQGEAPASEEPKEAWVDVAGQNKDKEAAESHESDEDGSVEDCDLDA
ncbi:hypothetical protein H632_c2308p0 [Helicosporidium sp. ATCC 50920]|nr:hypothetical protein H632_c2308p0 [Helicosporidium sp. ATCC 50920]|eukprot:KDD73316.1 hypothetical protein H632_c2308p0 [Helicosporidium sp. ATCC 50920]